MAVIKGKGQASGVRDLERIEPRLHPGHLGLAVGAPVGKEHHDLGLAVVRLDQ